MWQTTSSLPDASAASCPWRIASSAASLRSVATRSLDPTLMDSASHAAPRVSRRDGGPRASPSRGGVVLPSGPARREEAARDHEQEGQGKGKAQEGREQQG